MLSLPRARVGSLVGELRSYKMHGTTRKKKNHSNSKIKKYMVSELSTVFGRSALLFLPGSSLEPEVDFNPLSIKQRKLNKFH